MERKLISTILGMQKTRKPRKDKAAVLKKYMERVNRLQKERNELEKKVVSAERRIDSAASACYDIAKAAKRLGIAYYMDTEVEIHSNGFISLKYHGKEILRAKRSFKDGEAVNSVQKVVGRDISEKLLEKLRQIHKRLNLDVLVKRNEQSRLRKMIEAEMSVKERKKTEKDLREDIRKIKARARELRIL
ncbi:hypothetical protein M1293_02930 [Candidatus Parvarchaeota archaeon]|nr:hypothetical protein [Candidatus Parvarchaeota archaeon]